MAMEMLEYMVSWTLWILDHGVMNIQNEDLAGQEAKTGLW